MIDVPVCGGRVPNSIGSIICLASAYCQGEHGEGDGLVNPRALDLFLNERSVDPVAISNQMKGR